MIDESKKYEVYSWYIQDDPEDDKLLYTGTFAQCAAEARKFMFSHSPGGKWTKTFKYMEDEGFPLRWDSDEYAVYIEEQRKTAPCTFEGCEEGSYCYDYHPAEYATREMAFDAGDPSLEGTLYREEEYEWAPVRVARAITRNVGVAEKRFPTTETRRKNE